jgi:serine/threonine protein kinase
MDTHDDIFAVARELPAHERAAYLDAACDSPEQRARVEDLLKDANAADSFFAGMAQPPVPVIVEKAGDTIGRYKLLQKIGEGGFGVVFMAEQREPIVRRVALKIIKEGMDTRQVIARFEAERQALAMMEHPGIAKVFDAGATATGRPYFVMELVRGMSITAFCDAQEYDTRRRLELFTEVCSAVQHAHQKGIIHRDLKPSNIIVGLDGDRPVLKVIDFGIAKATQQQLTDKTLFTRHPALHLAGAGELVGDRHRHPLRHLQPRRAALRVADRQAADRCQRAARRRLRRDAADHPRERSAETVDPARDNR